MNLSSRLSWPPRASLHWNGMKLLGNGGMGDGFVSTAAHAGVRAGGLSATGIGGVGFDNQQELIAYLNTEWLGPTPEVRTA
jgi:hypothetical protein